MKYLLILSICIHALTNSHFGHTVANPIPSALSRELTLSELDYFANTDEGHAELEKEFESILGGKRRPWTVAELPENVKKNRYNDLLAYDHTRVVLESLTNESDSSDYINANYIDGQNGEREYVATQGPLPNTIKDFWSMIWQLNTTKIVMLANIIEHGETKVEKYWPDSTEVYGDITVTRLSEHEIPDIQHVVRTFSVQKEGVISPRIIRHFHFTGWPDMGVPEDRLSVVAIIHQARKYRPDSKAPMVVHCSAGIGRTGTIILTDSMMQKVRAEGVVDFPKRLDNMRIQRPDLVEKKAQYVFAHQAVYDFFNGTQTEEYLKKVEEEYIKVDDDFNMSVINLMQSLIMGNNCDTRNL